MSRQIKVLVVDDEADLLQLLTIRLHRAGYAVETADSAKAALATLERLQPHVVLTDLKMANMDGLGLLAEVKDRYPVLPVVVLTAHGTIPDAIAATKRGAFAFLTKPLDDHELLACIQDAVTFSSKDAAGVPQVQSREWRSKIVTRSASMEALLREAELAAASDASIIVQSDSGTGKELLAQAIHAASSRADESFVAVNCTAIPEALFESEMFGHVKGAFTGASHDRSGLFQQANKGTLFLDEVGDMPLSFQAKLLRALQEKTVRPVGADEPVAIDVRVITATHRDLEQSVASGEFRDDLFYRLSVITLELPPLSKRREDIPLLANHFLVQFDSEGVASGYSNSAMERLMTAPWPGNVRQLANVVQQCKVMSRTRLVSRSLVDRALRGRPNEFVPFATARDRFELEYLSNLLQMTHGNVSQAARLADRNRSKFYKLLKKHALEPSLFRAGGQVEERDRMES
ncbi:MAG: sigma 54-interacting transcriptional regulator [Gammaproteobacteria bacterium]|nr:sigma 54-interacting transcriptional regulator [Gammaproteobacteria bacterium]